VADGFDRDVEGRRDLFVGEALPDETQDLDFAVAQARRLSSAFFGFSGGGEHGIDQDGIEARRLRFANEKIGGLLG